MMTPNKNSKAFDVNEEVLAKVNGGTDISEFSEIFINSWNEMFGQPDGTYQYICTECGAVIKGTDLGRFYDEVLAHQETHKQDYSNILNPWNTYWNNQPETKR